VNQVHNQYVQINAQQYCKCDEDSLASSTLTCKSCITSLDKFPLVRGFEVLSYLYRRENNLNLMFVHLEEDVFTTAINSLVFTDIEPVLASLEMLYRLTKRGKTDICTRLA